MSLSAHIDHLLRYNHATLSLSCHLQKKGTTKENQDKCQSSARQIAIRAWQPAGIPQEDWDQYLATCWLSSRWQPGGCHPVPRERHPLRDGTKVAGPLGLPISMLVCVFNTGLNGKDKRQHPGLFLSREVLVFQLLMLLWLMHMDAYMHIYERNFYLCWYAHRFDDTCLVSDDVQELHCPKK